MMLANYALFGMTNPLWSFIIAPLALVSIGWWCHELEEWWYEKHPWEDKRPYDWSEED